MSVRKLTVTSCNVKFDPPDKDWTLYEVGVRDEAGEPIEEEFKSFTALPVGELIEYQVERQDHEKYGTSYLLHLPPGVKGPGKPNIGGMIAELEQRVGRLELEVRALKGGPAPSAALGSGSPL